MPDIYLRNQRKALAGYVYLLSGFWGFHSVLATNGTAFDFVFSLVTSWAATALCCVDARIHGRSVPSTAAWLIFGTWPVTVPIYVLLIHGFRRSWIVLLGILSVAGVYISGAIAAWIFLL